MTTRFSGGNLEEVEYPKLTDDRRQVMAKAHIAFDKVS
jgi:hypothetical protein